MNYFNYFSEIEETFVRRRGKTVFLSPLDWALIETWQERKVPLHIVLRSIEKVFDNFEKSKKKRSVKGLAFCSEEIEAQYDEWLESQVGKSDENFVDSDSDSAFSEETIAAHIEGVVETIRAAKTKLNNALAETCERALERLEEIRKNYTNAEKLEEDLSLLEKLLDTSLLNDFDVEKLAKFRIETEDELRSYKKAMEKDAFKRTFELLLLKKLRTEAEIPRLSLFHL